MSWEQLADIFRQDREEREARAGQPPVDCPNDGQLLEAGPDGELHCKFDGWIWSGEEVTW